RPRAVVVTRTLRRRSTAMSRMVRQKDWSARAVTARWATRKQQRPYESQAWKRAIMATNNEPESRRSRRLLAITVVLAAVAAIAVTALLINIFERKQEAKDPFYRVVELNDTIDDPAIWGKNFPLQYDLYMRTVDQQRTKYGGSEAMPQTPTDADPRSVV